jgi:NAD(P)-dependent dehydrogenase (short-subunit alcohol dehydrogenase family)
MNASQTPSDTRALDSSAQGKVIVITGASRGVGLETAKQLAGQGAEVAMVCRDRTRGERARSEIAQVATGKQPRLFLADLSTQADVRRVAEEVKESYDHVDVLINNAGIANATRQVSADGIEQTWATNHLAPFLLSELLLPLLVGAPAGRIINVTTEIYSKKLDLDNVQGDRKYSFFGAYRASKLGNVLFTRELAKRLDGAGVTALAVSPGPAKTNLGGDGPGGVMGMVTSVIRHTPLLRPADQAAGGIVWAATEPELSEASGQLYMRRKQLKLKGAATDPALAEAVWKLSEEQTGIDPERSSVTVVASGSTLGV